MKYNFDKPTNRRGTGSLKWDVPENELPMWVADMDFETVPEVVEALKKRVEHGIFGYSIMPDTWSQSYVNWWDKRHHITLNPDKLIFTTGVVPAISSAVRKLTTPAENVLVQTPTYNIFFNSIRNNGRNIVENHLLYDGREYHIDWETLERQLADPQTSLMILCNPHNPIGKIWDKETLARIGALCAENDVTVFSDEIHCDITAPGKEYVPFASVNEQCRQISVTAIAPTKTFNLAGIQSAAVYAENKVLHHKMWRRLNTDEVAEPNAFAMCATIAAFTCGADWLDELRVYIEENKKYVTDFIAREIPQMKVVPSEATYLMWLDCQAYTKDSNKLYAFIRKESGLYLASGREYGTNGDGFLRLNVATTRKNVEDGMERLKQSMKAWEQKLMKS
ncbi:MAG: pyridoxal phosphate-dependent aminotransferase [Roseburia sp.]|jgi:cystathionine beta-lyase|nr:pyridoxal phosphate-dependent aminotransferase [Roseburia sp.]